LTTLLLKMEESRVVVQDLSWRDKKQEAAGKKLTTLLLKMEESKVVAQDLS
jgi:hypothetical protein